MPTARRCALLLGLALTGCADDVVIEDDSSGAEEELTRAPFHLSGATPLLGSRIVRGGCTDGPDACTTRGDCEAVPVHCDPSDRMRISLRWSSSDDIDLYVEDPRGDVLSFLATSSPAGGRFEQPAGRSCLPGRTGGEETIAYEGPRVATGTYRVMLHHYGSCMSGLGTVDVDITLSAGDRHLATYRATIAPTQRDAFVLFEMAE